MLEDKALHHISKKISSVLDQNIELSHAQPAFGGDINTCFIATGNQSSFFIKTNRCKDADAMFTAESLGLMALSKQKQMKVPLPIVQGELKGLHYLVMDTLNISNKGNWEDFAHALLAVHGITQQEFGFVYDNYIGRTVQHNEAFKTWDDFWWEQRLLPQMTLAYRNGYQKPLEKLERLLEVTCYHLLKNHHPNPSLVHGDLWSGNLGFSDKQPCIYDPAVYFGDPEVDLALTELFGRLPQAFYNAYLSKTKLPPNHKTRFKLYNLYHLLNHLNLFGGHYLESSVYCIKDLADDCEKTCP